MSSPAVPSPQKKGAGAVAPVRVRTRLGCSSCFGPFSPVIGPRYPRILAPCAHTFCTECITDQLAARGPSKFRCLLHDQPVAISKAEDVKANFALIELLERIEKDADHQAVDEHTKPPPCSECDASSVWYCKNDDACFCDAHKVSFHSGQAQSAHAIMPVADRTSILAVPKCAHHKSKDSELWCTQCSALCCTMCNLSGPHMSHANKRPVDDVIGAQRENIEKLAKEASELAADKLDKEAQTLINLKADFEAGAHRVVDEIAKQDAEMMRAVQARSAALRKQSQDHLVLGLKHIDMRVDDLTMSRSRAAMVSEEAARVLRIIRLCAAGSHSQCGAEHGAHS